MKIESITKWFRRAKTAGQAEPTSQPVLEQLLKRMQVKWEKDSIDNGDAYEFKYQGGYFKVLTTENSPFIHIIFPFITTTGIANLHNIREICNGYNVATRYTKAIYTQMDEAPQSLALHLETNIRAEAYSQQLQQDFEWLLQTCFHDAHSLRHQLEEAQSEDAPNKEETQMYRHAEMAMLQEMEGKILNPQHTDRSRLGTDGTGSPSIKGILTRVFQTNAINFPQMTIATERLDHIEDEESIRDFKIANLLTQVDFAHSGDSTATPPQRFVRSEATAIVHVEIGGTAAQSIVFHLSAEDEGDDALAMRLTIACPEKAISAHHSHSSRDARERRHYSFLLNIPTKKGTDHLHHEYKYRLQEAQEAQKQRQTLTREQKLLLRCKDSELEYDAFCGYRHYVRKEFFNAIQHLENAFYRIRGKRRRLSASKMNLYHEICFYLGCCYVSLGMHERAQYFLNEIRHIHRYAYVLLCVRNMDRLHNPELLTYVNRMYNELQELHRYSGEEDLPEGLVRYRHFLLMTQIRLLADAGEFAEAMQWAKILQSEGYDSEQLGHMLAHLKEQAESIGKELENRERWNDIMEIFKEDTDEEDEIPKD